MCLLIALAIGAANAVGVLVLKIAPFVMTLCTMTILEGVCYVYTQGAPTGSAAPAIRTLGTGHLGQVPYSTVIWLALALLVWVVLRYTTLGRKLYAVGGNARAARLSGIIPTGLWWRARMCFQRLCPCWRALSCRAISTSPR